MVNDMLYEFIQNIIQTLDFREVLGSTELV